MKNIFVSYSRDSADRVADLIGDLETLGHDVWFDKELSGGQAWWARILEQIRACDVFILAVDDHALASEACKLELGYASALGVPVLPVLLDAGISTNLLPPALARLQFVNFASNDRNAALHLARAVASLPAKSPLPDPLPAPPDAPMSYLGGLAERIAARGDMSLTEQSALVLDLKHGLRDPSTSQDAKLLLQRLRNRRDLFKVIDVEIGEVLAGIEDASPAAAPRGGATTSAGPAPRAAGIAGLAAAPMTPGTDAKAGQGMISITARIAVVCAFAMLGAAVAYLGLYLHVAGYDPPRAIGRSGPGFEWLGITSAAFGFAGLLCGPRLSSVACSLGLAVIAGGITLAAFEGDREMWALATLIGAPSGACAGAVLWQALAWYKRDRHQAA